MKHLGRFNPIVAAALLLAPAVGAQTVASGQTPGSAQTAAAPKLTGFPFSEGETLRYSINWPSGLSLGEATLTAHRSPTGWSFTASVEAGLPGYAIADKFRSTVAGDDLCSADFERDTSQGGKKTRERTTFDQRKNTARRTTVLPENGGKTDIGIPSCARDALAFVYFARREMGQGRVAPQQQVFFGSAYTARMEYTGEQTIASGDKRAVTDHVVVYVKGPKADFNFEIFFARDAARTPLAIKVPLSVATFSLDLVR